MRVLSIKPQETYDILKNMHYAKRLPMIMFSYGLFINKTLKGIVTYGLPPSNSVCIGICGEKFKQDVLELNRLFLFDNNKNEASFLVSHSMKSLPKPKIIVSYADSSMKHTGYIYQATNFLYTGLSYKVKEWRLKNTNKHSRTLYGKYNVEQMRNSDDFECVERSRKHRYLYFIGSKKQKKEYLKNLNYKILSYPKGNNENYEVNHKTITQEILF